MLSLSNSYPNSRLDKACAIANRYQLYRLKQIKDILKSDQGKLRNEDNGPASPLPQHHVNIRDPQDFH